MTPTELQSERDRLAENAGHEYFSRHMNETIAGPSSLFEHGFAAGFDACLRLMLERERVLRESLSECHDELVEHYNRNKCFHCNEVLNRASKALAAVGEG